MIRNKPDPRLSGWVQMVVSLAFVARDDGRGGHNVVPGPRPPTGLCNYGH